MTTTLFTPDSAAWWQEHLNLIERYFEEVWNQGKLQALDEIIAPDYINHSPAGMQPAPGPEGLKPIVTAVRVAFPDLHYSILDTVITHDRIVARVKMTGTHDGDFFGIAATGKKIEVEQINIEYVCNGRITEHWRITDNQTMMQQLGLA
jgi:steroid delta-isomerase-like uncharacterized protein